MENTGQDLFKTQAGILSSLIHSSTQNTGGAMHKSN